MSRTLQARRQELAQVERQIAQARQAGNADEMAAHLPKVSAMQNIIADLEGQHRQAQGVVQARQQAVADVHGKAKALAAKIEGIEYALAYGHWPRILAEARERLAAIEGGKAQEEARLAGLRRELAALAGPGQEV